MSMLEWIGESVSPGPTGSIELGGETRPSRASGLQVLFQLALAGLLVGGALWLVFGPIGVERTSHNLTVALVITFSYLGIAWLIRPRPDMSNLGWGGGLIDDPFRYSDDLNRNLLFFSLLLMPGRFVAECLVDAIAFPFGGAAKPAARSPRRAPRVRGVRATRGRW